MVLWTARPAGDGVQAQAQLPGQLGIGNQAGLRAAGCHRANPRHGPSLGSYCSWTGTRSPSPPAHGRGCPQPSSTDGGNQSRPRHWTMLRLRPLAWQLSRNAKHLDALQHQAPRHDQSDVARTEDHQPSVPARRHHVDEFLSQPHGEDALPATSPGSEPRRGVHSPRTHGQYGSTCPPTPRTPWAVDIN